LGVILVKKETFSRLTLAAIDAALEAGEILRKGFGTSFTISSKEGRHNLVTDYDIKAEKSIISALKQMVPGSCFLAEESGATGEKGPPETHRLRGKEEGPPETHRLRGKKVDLLWIIDPLDGTVNFAHGIPIFSVSIALEKNGQIQTGVVYQPLHHELFVAELGNGAFLNGEPIRVSPVLRLEESMLATGFPYNLADNPFHCIDHFIDVLKLGVPIRRLGSAALDLAYTAAGHFEGFFEVSLSPWDCAAGQLLVAEAGGKVSHWDKTTFSAHGKNPILATNGHIHDPLLKILNNTSFG
jgi:myo-inositol-1(or 4)-monophosphatase